MSEMCATCPFRKGSPYAYLRDDLTVSAMTTSISPSYRHIYAPEVLAKRPVTKATDIFMAGCSFAALMGQSYTCKTTERRIPRDRRAQPAAPQVQLR
jgi:hypothetical protein